MAHTNFGQDYQLTTGTLLLVIALSFVVASSLNVYPLDSSFASLRPMVMIMVLIFWLLFQPRYVGVFTAFTIGLIADLLLDTLLGQQAFAAVTVALFIKVISIYIKQVNTAIIWIIASLSLVVFQLMLWLLQALTQNVFFFQSAFSLLISILSWPLILLVLRRFSASSSV